MSSRDRAFSVPTLESGVYLLLVLGAAALRLWDIGGRPLSPQEADLAYRAWGFYQGQVAEPDPSQPLLFQATLLSYFILGSSDAVVRFVPAMIGTALVAAAYFLREAIGRVSALLVALFLAVSPISIFFSRYLGGEVVEALASMLVVAGIFGYVQSKSPHHFYLAAVGAAMAVLGAGLLTPLLGALFLFPLLYALANFLGSGNFHEVVNQVREEIPPSDLLGRAGIIFLGMIILLPTGGFLVPHGLEAVVTGLLAAPHPLSAGPPFVLLLAYDPLLFILGILGGLFLIQENPRAVFLLLWLAVGFVLGTATNPLAISPPLTLLAGMTIADVTRRRNSVSSPDLIRILFIAIPLLIYLIMQWASYSSSGDVRHLFLMVLALAILAGLIAFFGASKGWGLAAKGGLLVVLLLGGALTLHNTLRLAYEDFSTTPEFIIGENTSPDVRNLAENLKNLSNQTTGQRQALGIATTTKDPVLLWYLRGFRNLKVVSSSTLDRDSAVIITREEEALGKEGYFGEKYTLRIHWPRPSLGFREFSRWLLLREVDAAAEASGIIIWRPTVD